MNTEEQTPTPTIREDELKNTLNILAASMLNMRELLKKLLETKESQNTSTNPDLAPQVQNQSNSTNINHETGVFMAAKPTLPAVILNEDSDYESWLNHTRNEIKSFQL